MGNIISAIFDFYVRLRDRPSTVAHLETDSVVSLLITSLLFTKPIPPPLSATEFAGKTALVTGSNTGLGLESSRQLLQHGLSHLIMGVRSLEKGESAAELLRKEFPGRKITVARLDMADFQSVEEFAQELERGKEKVDKLDMAILNIGMLQPKFLLTRDRHEEVFQVNYLATALLAILLLPLLKSAAKNNEGNRPGRLTIVSSTMGLVAKFTERKEESVLRALDTKTAGREWTLEDTGERYSVTKMLQMYLTKKLGEATDREEVVVNCVDPSWVGKTGLNSPMPFFVKVINFFVGVLMGRTVKQGGWAYLDAVAVKGPESHGRLVRDWEVGTYHPMIDTEEGGKILEGLWEETLDELEFAGVRRILDGGKAGGKGQGQVRGET
ncbi:short-chain dehydrogenase reductase family [Podospora australis]|uniref:Short-chain dehydrogenase reductase family n=1 Tax=Podospora australis TaxID=1536484 RepID=A0AAN6WV92_9PEZI|nr:short-chain dehydrogenase reductase family [Podospora australis]